MARRAKTAAGGFDRTPPQNIDAERSVLGAMLINPEAVGVAIECLGGNASDTFALEAHQHLYAAMHELTRRNKVVDPVLLLAQLEEFGKLEASGGPSYIAELMSAVPTSANVEYYANIVRDMAMLRKLIATCSSLAGEAYQAEGPVETLLDKAESEIYRIAERRQLSPINLLRDLLTPAVERIDEQIKNKGKITGLATGFIKLDEMLSGLQPSDMIILAARPSVGKTAFALNIAAHASIQHKKGVLLFSVEMAKEPLVQRLLCIVGNVDSERLRTGFLARDEFPKVQQAAALLQHSDIYIDESPHLSPLELRSKARRHKSRYPVDLIVIDYLQLMATTGRAENRQVEIAEISRAIKGIARELKIPVLALSQLSREADKDDSGMPRLSHLRESGAIEQDADVVLMLSRPRIDKRKSDDDDAGPLDENIVYLNVAKQRNGPTGGMRLIFEKNYQRFLNPADLPPGKTPPPFERGASPPVEQPAYDPYTEAGYDEDDVPF